MAEVVLDRVSKRFGRVVALQGASLAVRDAEFVVLVGPSGCGKSTTLRLIAGLEEVTEGTIAIDGRVVNHVPPKDRDIAMVFQNYALYPHMTVYDNMAFGLKLRRVPRAEIDRRVRSAARLLGIEGLLDRKPRQLSGGQRQRVAVGRAIVREPKVFLMDEPLSNLDARLRLQMRAELARLHDRLRTTTLYVTHDQTEAMTLGQRLVVMKDGVIQQVGTPLEVYHHPRNCFVAGFIGSPPMNFLPGVLRAAEGEYTFEAEAFRLPLPRELAGRLRTLDRYNHRRVILGVRPEHVHPAPPGAGSPGEAAPVATVEVVEPAGAESYLHLSLGNHTVVSRVTGEVRAAAGDPCPLRFDLACCHLFDPASEERID